jgi:hypothetical protein
VLEKYAVTLTCAGKRAVDKRRYPYADVDALIRLRNALIHFKPEVQWNDEVHAIRKRMEHLVPKNPLMLDTQPWFPHQPLCAGVARWAWQASMAFDQWQSQMGLTVSYRDGMSVPWPDGLS